MGWERRFHDPKKGLKAELPHVHNIVFFVFLVAFLNFRFFFFNSFELPMPAFSFSIAGFHLKLSMIRGKREPHRETHRNTSLTVESHAGFHVRV